MAVTMTLRVLAFLTGFAAIALTVEALISGAASFLSVLWYWPISSGAGVSALRSVQLPPDLLRILVAQLVIHATAMVTGFVLAARRNRHRWDWAALALLFPPALAVLPFLSYGTADRDRWGGVIGRMLYLYASLVQHKKCGRCNKAVPLYMRAREACPHCGIVWAETKAVFERYPGESHRGGV
jgi:hypothetical protein